MSKRWKKNGRTYDTDRYETSYHFVGDSFYRNTWEESPFVGPDSYNRSHIDLIMDNRYNRADFITDGKGNPYLTAKATLSPEKAKFKP